MADDVTRRTVTPSQVAEQQRGSTRIAPGIWLDREGGIHFSVPELLALVDLPDTPEHRAAVTEMVTRQFRELCPGQRVVVQDPES